MVKRVSNATQKLIEHERLARIDLRQAAVGYANVAGDEDDDAWTAAWGKLRDSALAYATATHDATRARAKESK